MVVSCGSRLFLEAALGVLDRLILRDDQWERMSRHVIGDERTRGPSGRDNRMFVEAVLWIVRTGSLWRDLPDVFGSWNSVFRRFSRWSAKGIWRRIFAAMSDDGDLEYLILDSTIVRAHQHAAGAKRGAEDQALGRSRGGLSTKIHLAVRGLGCPVAFHLTGGHKSDAPQAAILVKGRRAEIVLADAAYDADHFRSYIAAMNATAVIPNNPSRTAKHPFDRQLYKERTSSNAALQAQAVPPRCHPLRENLSKLPCRRHTRRNHPVAAVSVHTT